MKYVKIATIAGKRYKIVSDNITLDLSSPGRAIFVLQSDSILSGIITLSAGMLYSQIERFYTGYIESCHQIDKKQVRIMTREMNATLQARLPISQRNIFAKDVINLISESSGLKFVFTPNNNWQNEKIPHFINMQTGINALQLLGKHCDIRNFIYQSDQLGKINIGELPNKSIIIEHSFFYDHTVTGASCAFLPALRPGIKLAIGNSKPKLINTIQINAEIMRINF